MITPAISEYLSTLLQVWRQTGDTSDTTIAQILNIEPESVRRRRVRAYDALLPEQDKRDIPMLLHCCLEDAHLL